MTHVIVCSCGCNQLTPKQTAIRGRNPDHHRANERRRAQTIRPNHPSYQAHQTSAHRRLRKQIQKRDNNTCQRCSKHVTGFDATLHYIVPLPQGDMHPSNCLLLCRSCNARLGRTTPVAAKARHPRTSVARVSRNSVGG